MLTEPLSGLLAYIQQPPLIGALLMAVPLGMLAGVVPGPGGKLSIVLALPFLLGGDPVLGAVFLLAMHSVIHTSGPIPSILFGIGAGPEAATAVDGYPLARKGAANRALGAALAASCVGGLIGALALALTIPAVQPLILGMGPPEMFLLAVLGMTFIASVGGGELHRGVLVGCLGLLVATVGMDPMSGVLRFTFGWFFLWDGVDLITATIGLFAVPELIALLRAQTVPAPLQPDAGTTPDRIREGVLDVWRHRALTLRASLIGTVVGLIPGLGGEVASWVAYGHAVQSSKRPEEFGSGRIEGVIAPESANNSKEGGSLLPTLFFGLPGSSGMAVMLGAFISLGIVPGPALAEQGMPLVWTLVWALVLANLLSVPLFLLGARPLSRCARLPGPLVFALVTPFALLACLLSAMHWQALLLLFAFGLLGDAFKRNGWSRVPFAIGLVLGAPAEIALNQSLMLWGPGFLLRPACLVLLALVVLSLAFNLSRRIRTEEEASASESWPGWLLLLLFSAALVTAMAYPGQAATLPVAIAVAAIPLALTEVVHSLRRKRPWSLAAAAGGMVPGRIGWFAAFVATTVLAGLSPGLPLLMPWFLWRKAGTRPLPALAAGLTVALVLELLFAGLLGVDLYRGLIAEHWPGG